MASGVFENQWTGMDFALFSQVLSHDVRKHCRRNLGTRTSQEFHSRPQNWRIRSWWVLRDVAFMDVDRVKAHSHCSEAREVDLSEQACRASCSWSRTAACPWVVSRWASCLPGAQRRAARWQATRQCAAMADAARAARNGWADWGTDSLHTPPGHTETFPGCFPHGPRLTGP